MFLRDVDGNGVWFNTMEGIAIQAHFSMHVAFPVTTERRFETALIDTTAILSEPSELTSWRLPYEQFIPGARELAEDYFVTTTFQGVSRTYVDVVLALVITQSDGSVFESREAYSMTVPDEW